MQYIRVKDDANGLADMIRVTLEPNDPVLESLIYVAEQEKIEAASILEGSSMIKGPVRLGWYDLDKGKFADFKDFKEKYDVVSVAGNITRRKETGEYAMHLHMSFASAAAPSLKGVKGVVNKVLRLGGFDPAYAVKGGHVMIEKKDTPDSRTRFKNDFTASPTAEFTLLVQNGMGVERRMISGCPLPLIMPKADINLPERHVGSRELPSNPIRP